MEASLLPDTSHTTYDDVDETGKGVFPTPHLRYFQTIAEVIVDAAVASGWKWWKGRRAVNFPVTTE